MWPTAPTAASGAAYPRFLKACVVGLVMYEIGENLMNIIIWLVIGGLIGWLASVVMKTNDSQGLILNVVVGVIGAALAGWFISPLVGVGTINQDNFSLPALIVSFIGAVILLGIVNLLRRGTARA
jgi:uncharacterized membrane protein YeaQ/YmgE (transglycosylase-associated protein family)